MGNCPLSRHQALGGRYKDQSCQAYGSDAEVPRQKWHYVCFPGTEAKKWDAGTITQLSLWNVHKVVVPANER